MEERPANLVTTAEARGWANDVGGEGEAWLGVFCRERGEREGESSEG